MTQLSIQAKSRMFLFHDKIYHHIKTQYPTILSQISNVLKDLGRFLIIIKTSNIEELLNECGKFIDETLSNNQKISVFKIKANMDDDIDNFIEYFINVLEDFCYSEEKSEKIEKETNMSQNDSSNIDFEHQKLFLQSLISNLALSLFYESKRHKRRR
ncbi:MAG: hypothetical protein K9W44_00615 [Candidatus Lokiarchaeota archaeon]|nr:hypothetical protein [Candidatus Harpocratesius repetitus]